MEGPHWLFLSLFLLCSGFLYLRSDVNAAHVLSLPDLAYSVISTTEQPQDSAKMVTESMSDVDVHTQPPEHTGNKGVEALFHQSHTPGQYSNKTIPEPAYFRDVIVSGAEQELLNFLDHDPNPEWETILSSLEIDYETCRDSLARQDSIQRKKTLSRLKWMHIPKAGTSFGAVFYAYTCTESKKNAHLQQQRCDNRDNGDSITKSKKNCTHNIIKRPPKYCVMCGPYSKPLWPPLLRRHIPFSKIDVCEEKVIMATNPISHHSFSQISNSPPMYAGLFREPRSRLVSAYNYQKHSFGLIDRLKFLHRVHTFNDYVNAPEIRGCATKMLLGKFCAQKLTLTVKHLHKALRNLERFAFVGLTDAYNASVCLFHHMHGGELYPFEFVQVREAMPYNVNETLKLPGHSRRVPRESWFVMSLSSHVAQ